jgi:hypothetical protein
LETYDNNLDIIGLGKGSKEAGSNATVNGGGGEIN